MNILDCPMEANDSGADTIRGYLKELLKMLWSEGECFSGKRPFGNSGWEDDMILALAKNGFIETTRTKWEELEYDSREGEVLIFEAIDAL